MIALPQILLHRSKLLQLLPLLPHRQLLNVQLQLPLPLLLPLQRLLNVLLQLPPLSPLLPLLLPIPLQRQQHRPPVPLLLARTHRLALS